MKHFKSKNILAIMLIFLLIQFGITLGQDAPKKDTSVIQNAFPNLNFKNPVDLTFPNDGTDRIFVVEKVGKIVWFANDKNAKEKNTFLDISDKVLNEGECGLLGLAFHPDYKKNGFFFVNYTTKKPVKTIVARFQVDPKNPSLALPDSFLILLEIEQPYQNHNGGQIVFGPDGFLYIGMGDGGSGGDPQNRAQNLKVLLGKMLRINVDLPQKDLNYSIPTSNPFVKNTLGYREEIYAYGLRNPWRFSFDSKTKKLWCGDVGQGEWEEIDVITNGGNFGWNIIEGNHNFNKSKDDPSKFIAPVFEYNHSDKNCSITGGFVYYGKLRPDLVGAYIYTDYCSKNIWQLNITTKSNSSIGFAPASINSFGVDSKNELYLLGGNGIIYSFTSTSK
jgi:glucose/arabinose dehydrogenase